MADGNGTQHDIGLLKGQVEALKEQGDRTEEKVDRLLEAFNQAKGGAKVAWVGLTGIGSVAGFVGGLISKKLGMP